MLDAVQSRDVGPVKRAAKAGAEGANRSGRCSRSSSGTSSCGNAVLSPHRLPAHTARPGREEVTGMLIADTAMY